MSTVIPSGPYAGTYVRVPGSKRQYKNIDTGQVFSRRAYEEKVLGKGKRYFEKKALKNLVSSPEEHLNRPARGRSSKSVSQNPHLQNALVSAKSFSYILTLLSGKWIEESYVNHSISDFQVPSGGAFLDTLSFARHLSSVVNNYINNGITVSGLKNPEIKKYLKIINRQSLRDMMKCIQLLGEVYLGKPGFKYVFETVGVPRKAKGGAIAFDAQDISLGFKDFFNKYKTATIYHYTIGASICKHVSRDLTEEDEDAIITLSNIIGEG